MKEKYLNDLRMYLTQYGVENKEDIIIKYKNRFELGLEAGFSEEEIIAKCGHPEIIAQSYENEETEIYEDDIIEVVYDNIEEGKSIILDSDAIIKIKTISQDVKIIENDTVYTTIYIPEKIQKRFNQTIESNKIVLEYKNKSFFGDSSGGQLVIKLGQNASLTSLDIDTVSGDINCDVNNTITKNTLKTVSGDIELRNSKSDLVETVVVSGDILCENAKGVEIKMSTISGDATFKNAEFKIFKGSTISGDINYVGNQAIIVESVSTISGEITINGKSYPSTITKAKDTIKNVFNKNNNEKKD